ncbi:MAG: DNA replication and repair protein RecF [Mariprofundaceae bacterium]|nr:DNA replication and repair protein RecF [Mariprofundaceae bacterium]
MDVQHNMPNIVRLKLQRLHLQNLRCHHDYTWECSEDLNLICGDNGCGKTTLLEAAYMLAYGRSFRQAKAPQLTRWDSKSFHIQATIQRYGPLHIRLDGQKGKVQMTLQGRKVAQRKEVFEHISLIVDAPQGVRLIDGTPGERRKWLDRLVIATIPASHVVYQSYLRALMQRSRLLRKAGSASELASWEQQIVDFGLILNQRRAAVLTQLNTFLEAENTWLDLPFQLELVGQIFANKEAWLLWLQEKREEHQRLGRVSQGPHCDRLKIGYNGREIRVCGSRGQQKLSGIALRLAECLVVQQAKRLMPILLLDDCLESLDHTRVLRLMQRLQQHQGQVLMTAPGDVSPDVLQHTACLRL